MKKGDVVETLHGIVGPDNWETLPKGSLGLVLSLIQTKSTNITLVSVLFPCGLRDIYKHSLCVVFSGV